MPGNASAKQQQTISVGVLQDKMNKTVAHDPAKHTMTIQAGMKLREFAAEATRLGMSVQVGSLPAYAGLTVGGVLSTSGHGSGDQATSNLCDTVISLTWVDHNGDIQKVSTHLWQASCQVRIATVNFQLTGKVFRSRSQECLHIGHVPLTKATPFAFSLSQPPSPPPPKTAAPKHGLSEYCQTIPH